MWTINSFEKLMNKLELKKSSINNNYLEDFNIHETFIDDSNLDKSLLDYLYNDLIDDEHLYLKDNKESLILDEYKIEKYKNINPKEIIKEDSLDIKIIRIRDLFNDNKYVMFKKFCEKKQINYIDEITESLIIEFSSKPGAGIKKINDLKEILNEIYLKHINLKYNIFSINFIFCENKFESLRKFCEKNKIYNINELTDYMLNKFKEEYKCNKKLICTIKDQIHINVKRRKVIKEFKIICKEKILLKDYWYNILKNFKVDFINNKLGLTLSKNKYKIKDLQNKKAKDICKDYYIPSLKFINFLNDIKSPEEIIKDLDNILEDEREKRIFFKRYNNNITLEKIGIEENLTRERVRQILKKTEDSVSSFLNVNRFNISLQLKYITKDMCSIKNLYEISTPNKIFYINSLIKMNNIGLSFVEALNLIIFKSENILDDKIKFIVNSLPESFNLYNYIDTLIYKLKELGIKEITIEEIKGLLVYYEFNIYGKYCFKSKITIIKACEVIFKDYLINPLRIDDKGIHIIKTLAYNHLNLRLDSNDKALESRIREIDSVLLVDKLTFIHINHINVSENTLIYLKNLLQIIFKEREVINASFLFENNKELMMKNNIDNKYILYSLIHYYYGKNYSIGKGNTLDIYRNKLN